jgi:hypothetical protein
MMKFPIYGKMKKRSEPPTRYNIPDTIFGASNRTTSMSPVLFGCKMLPMNTPMP